MNAARFAIVLCVPLVACYHHRGELGNLGFELGIVDTLHEFESGDRVLVGTRLCPALAHAKVGDEVQPLGSLDQQCFSEVVSGPAQFDTHHCWALDTLGEVIWEVIPTNVEGCDPEYQSDRIVVEVAAPSGAVQLGFDDWRLRFPLTVSRFEGISYEVVGLESGQTHDDLREDPGSPRRVFEGQLDTPMLRLDDDLGRLYMGDVAVELVGEGARPVGWPDPETPAGKIRLPGERPLVLEADAVARVRATLPGGLVLESRELIAVPPSEAASLDLVVMLQAGIPTYAHARVRDAEGRVLHAAPIEWSVAEGALRVLPGDLDNQARSGEFAVVGGGCEPPSESTFIERHAVLRARLGTLEDTVELTWAEPPVQPGTPFQPDENCEFSPWWTGDQTSSCSVDADRSPMGVAGLALAALLFVRRRRSAPGQR
jgi:MYXO-CTERM domain-containing protein